MAELASLIPLSLSDGTDVGMLAFMKKWYSDMSSIFDWAQTIENSCYNPETTCTNMWLANCFACTQSNMNEFTLTKFHFVVVWLIHQTAQINSLPTFLAILYVNILDVISHTMNEWKDIYDWRMHQKNLKQLIWFGSAFTCCKRRLRWFTLLL